MSQDWPGDWISGAAKIAQEKDTSFTNDNGILCLTGDEAEEYLFMEDVPSHLETHA